MTNLGSRLILSSLFTLGALGTGTARADAPAPLTVEPAARAKMKVCTDGKSRLIAIGPHERVSYQLYFGDGKSMTSVGVDPSGMVPGNDFLDPRFPNPTANPSFRGIDWRNYSSVEYNEEKNSCELRCGTKKIPLTVMPDAEAKKLVADAKFVANPRTREPHMLARDDHGTYYFVDRGNTPETNGSYRIYVGKKGALKQQKMKDVASDSAGQVFSTANGALRFVSTEGSYRWIAGKAKPVELVNLPIPENLNLIYTGLGIYTGQPMGTPCDAY